MDFTFTEEQEAVRALAEQIFAGHASTERVKDVEAGDERFDRAVWAELAGREPPRIALPDEVGGSGFGVIELCLLLEQQGRGCRPAAAVADARAAVRSRSPSRHRRPTPALAAGRGRRRGRAQRRARGVRAGAHRTRGRCRRGASTARG